MKVGMKRDEKGSGKDFGGGLRSHNLPGRSRPLCPVELPRSVMSMHGGAVGWIRTIMPAFGERNPVRWMTAADDGDDDWRPREDSNRRDEIRNLVSYPLDDEGMGPCCGNRTHLPGLESRCLDRSAKHGENSGMMRMGEVDPVPRFELGSARWQRAVLPLNDTGKHGAEESNPTHRFWKPGPGHWTSTVKKPLGDLR